jgi:hypothetical protein
VAQEILDSIPQPHLLRFAQRPLSEASLMPELLSSYTDGQAKQLLDPQQKASAAWQIDNEAHETPVSTAQNHPIRFARRQLRQGVTSAISSAQRNNPN